MKLKTLVFAAALMTLSAGMASAQRWSRCFDNNSKACVDARNSFARHHGGMLPEQYYNSWYNGGRGRWYQRDGGWRWEGIDGRQYWKGPRGWEWAHHHHY